MAEQAFLIKVDGRDAAEWQFEAARLREAIKGALDELGVPGLDYPAPVANAVGILCTALADCPEPHPYIEAQKTSQPAEPLDGSPDA